MNTNDSSSGSGGGSGSGSSSSSRQYLRRRRVRPRPVTGDAVGGSNNHATVDRISSQHQHQQQSHYAIEREIWEKTHCSGSTAQIYYHHDAVYDVPQHHDDDEESLLLSSSSTFCGGGGGVGCDGSGSGGSGSDYCTEENYENGLFQFPHFHSFASGSASAVIGDPTFLSFLEGSTTGEDEDDDDKDKDEIKRYDDNDNKHKSTTRSSSDDYHHQHQHHQQQQQHPIYVRCCDSPLITTIPPPEYYYPITTTLRRELVEEPMVEFPPFPIIMLNNNGKPSATNITTIGNSTNGATTHPIVSGIQLLVSSIAVILCCITILAMTLPLLDKKKRKRLSTYNLYLVFLSIPDLVYNIFLIYLFSEYLFSEYDSGILNRADDTSSLPLIDHPIDLALFTTCATANLYTNAIISYEILKLLRDSKARRRSYPPTLKKATIQASFAYILGIIIFLVDFFAGDYLKTWPIWIIGPIYYGISVGIPVLYLLWVCFCIQYEKLLLSNSGKKMKVLVRYFGRIIIVYVCIWLPASILYSLQWSHASHPGLLYFLACFFYAIQVWVSFGLSLTKPDVRIAICYLLKFKYCRRCWYNYNKNKNNNGNEDHKDQVVEVILNGRRPRTTDRRRRQHDNNNSNSNNKNNNANSSGTISGVSAISDDDDDDDDFDGGSRDTISNDCDINNILVKEEGNNSTIKHRHVSLASSLYAHSSSIHTLFGGGGSGGVSVSGAFNSSDGSFGSFSTGFNISEKQSIPAFRRNSRDDYNDFLTVLEEECNLHGVNNDGNDNQRDMMNTNNNNDTNSMTVIDSTNSNKDVGEEEDKEGIKEEEEIKDNSIHNDHHKGVNDANNSFSLSSGDIEEYTTLRPSSPTSTTPSSPTRNPLMRIINPLVGVFRSSSASSAGGDNNNSSMKVDDEDVDDSNGIVETPGNSDSPSSSSSNNTKNRMDLQQKIMNLRHNVAELRQQLKYAVTDEEKDLFRQSIASQRHVLARMSSISLDIDDSEDSLFGFPGDGTATGTDTDTYSNRYTIPNNNGSSSSNNNTCSNNKNSNSNKRVDSCANNAYQRSPLDVINDDSTCSKGDDGNYDNDDTDINDSLSSIGLDNKVENKD